MICKERGEKGEVGKDKCAVKRSYTSQYLYVSPELSPSPQGVKMAKYNMSGAKAPSWEWSVTR